MNEPFLLEVTYQNKPLEFPAAFQRWGYTFRIVVSINEMNYIFEPDEEGSYRVLGSAEGVDIDLLKVIVEKLRSLNH